MKKNKQSKKTFFQDKRNKNRTPKISDIYLKIYLNYKCGKSVTCFSQTQNETSNTSMEPQQEVWGTLRDQAGLTPVRPWAPSKAPQELAKDTEAN